MSPDAVPQSAPAGLATVAWRRTASDERRDGATVTDLGAASGARSLDGSLWSRWWRDLIIERYRLAGFDDLVPLPGGGSCPWARRVHLGRIVEQALGDVHGPGTTARLVAEALAVAGFGGASDPGGRRWEAPAGRIGRWSSSVAGDEELHLAVLGSVADALLREVPPIDWPGLDTGGEVAADVDGTVARATRDAIVAYALHVEDLATGALVAVRTLRA